MSRIVDFLVGHKQIHPDIPGLACRDFMETGKDRKIRVYSPMFYNDYIRPSLYFRDPSDMPELELHALDLCHGKVLDAGAGAGSHSLVLQDRGMDVTALDYSPGMCYVMRERGLEKVVHSDLFEYKENGFDSILMMMNGIGLAGSLDKLESLIKRLPDWLDKGGRLIFDSSDLTFLAGGKKNLADMNFGLSYYGEMTFRFGYRRLLGPWFRWIYADYKTVEKIAVRYGFKIDKISEGKNNHYLAVITI